MRALEPKQAGQNGARAGVLRAALWAAGAGVVFAATFSGAIAHAFSIRATQKISQTMGGFSGTIGNGDEFGSAVATPGDLDDDGVRDAVVGARKNDDGSSHKGAAWVLFMNANGTVRTQQKISSGNGNFVGGAGGTEFGSAAAVIGDLNGDGIGDIAVGAAQDNDGGSDRGAVWILHLNANGTVKSNVKISATQGGFGGALQDNDAFGTSVAAVGDLDEDGVVDLAVGAPEDDTDGGNRGAVWILFLNANGTVKSETKITALSIIAGPPLAGDQFGTAVASVGDVDGDGIPDLAVGAPKHDSGGSDRGGVWILFLRRNGSVRASQAISATAGGFTGLLDDGDLFGSAVAGLTVVGNDGSVDTADLDGDGTVDLAVGAPNDDDGGDNRGAAWILHLAADGTVVSHDKIAVGSGGFAGTLDKDDYFGASVAAIGDLDGDGVSEIGVGASLDDDGGGERGALYVLFPEVCGNGIVALDEECDDGNREDGDCCSADCVLEAAGSPCSDGNVCTDDQCNGSGTCTSTTNVAACDDGLFCNGSDTCGGGACSVHAGNPCAGPDGDGDCAESCDDIADACTAPDPDGAACSDGTFCNGTDTCGGGSCVVHAGDPCAGPDGDGDCAESCDEIADACTAADPEASPCSDGIFCNGADSCSAGACAVHAGDPCSGGSVCGNACDEAAGNCGVVDGSPCDDGLFCTGTDSCNAGDCTQHSGDPCTGPDGDFDCAESCDEGADNCFAADPDGAVCDDGLFCNGSDTCGGGNCAAHSGDPCAGGPQCADACDEAGDSCLAVDGVPCDDGMFCTQTDECSGGACVGVTNPCGGTGSCTDTCNEDEDACKACGEPFSGIYCLPNAVITLRAAVGLETCDLCLCDVDGNGSILVTDALRILRVCLDLDPAPDACPAPGAASLWEGSTTISLAVTTTTLSGSGR